MIISGEQLKQMFLSGSCNLRNNRVMIDNLNVFPVPDGDTGTNMNLTITAAEKALKNSTASTAEQVAEVIANATIRGARGNSGVILSQLFRGISRGIKGKTEISVKEFAEALKLGADTAYKAVMTPAEGTILTVSKDAALAAIAASDKDIDVITMMELTVKGASESLERTPEILPILKQAGVVDAGGKGYLIILEGMLAYLKGTPVLVSETEPEEAVIAPIIDVTQDIKFIYCTEFLINNPNKSAKKCRSVLEKMGDSMVFVDDEDIIKVHIHTNTPGLVLHEAMKVGELTNLKIDNMKHQHSEISNSAVQETKPSKPIEHKPYAFVAVAAGGGIEQIFKDLGVDQLVHGGQSMNPGTEDILDACNRISADVIYVLPNNKNIILAAEQAKELTDANIVVIPSKSIPQGIGAILAYDDNRSDNENISAMNDAVKAVKTGLVTFAARDTTFDDREIKTGDILGMKESKLAVVGSDVNIVAQEITEGFADEGCEIITIFYGEDVTKEQADMLTKTIQDKYKTTDVIVHYGGQPLYYYIISVE